MINGKRRKNNRPHNNHAVQQHIPDYVIGHTEFNVFRVFSGTADIDKKELYLLSDFSEWHYSFLPGRGNPLRKEYFIT